MAYQGSSELMKEVINKEFNSRQWLGRKESNTPGEEITPIFTDLICKRGGLSQETMCTLPWRQVIFGIYNYRDLSSFGPIYV